MSYITTPFGARLKEEELYRSIESLSADIGDAFLKSMSDVFKAGAGDYVYLWSDIIDKKLEGPLNELLKEASEAWESAKERQENA